MSFLQRIGFRFLLLYLVLYGTSSQILAGLLGQVAEPLVRWVAEHIFGVIATSARTGSGDRTFDWVLAFIVLVIAIAGTVVWSAVDQRTTAYPNGYRRLRVLIRFALGSQLVSYGAYKLIPIQMPAPSVSQLLEPLGHLTPMGILWASLGASLPYQRFVGGVELMAGILLFIPRTSVLGALIALAATLQVFVLNMTYDVPVKLFSFHLLMFAVFLVVPAIRQLSGVLFARGAGARWSAVVQITAGAVLTAGALIGATRTWAQAGGGAPRPPLYGVWKIDLMRTDGVERPLLLTAADWREVLIQNDKSIVLRRLDNVSSYLSATYNIDARTITVRGAAASGTLTFTNPDASHLILDGRLTGRAVRIETTRVDEQTLPLLRPGFHWVQEYPFNR